MLQLNRLNNFSSNLRVFARKNWLLLTLVGVGLLALLGFALRYTAQRLQTATPSLTNQGNVNQTKTNYSNLTFTGDAPRIPEKMWVARVERFDQPDDQSLVTALVKKYELQPSPHVAGIWNGPSYSLEFDQSKNEYRLSKNLTAATGKAKTISPASVNRLVSTAARAVKEIFPETSYVPFPQQVEYLIADGLYEPSPIETATHIRVPFGLSYFEVPVLLNFSRSFPMTVALDAEGEITTLVAQPFSADFQPESQHFSLSVQEAIQQIQQGNASIIDSYSEQTITPDLKQIVRGEFSAAALEYRIDTKTNLLVPYYHFTGTLVNFDNDIFSAEVITPAVRLEQ